jgi:hypothetical protein
MSFLKTSSLLVCATLTFSVATFGQTEVPHTFTAGEPARAAEVNENFDALEAAIDVNATAITQIPVGPEGPQGPQGEQGPQGPTGDAAAPGSIGLTQINAAEVQARVGSTCSLGSFISGIAANGSASCGDGGSRDSIFTTRYGQEALFSNTSGYGNVASGYQALFWNTIGESNTAYGTQALRENTVGNFNTALGHQALYSNTTGSLNIAIGTSALHSITEGSYNIGIGFAAGGFKTTGSRNISIGNDEGGDESYTTRIGENSQERAFIAGIRGRTPDLAQTAVNVVIDGAGQLGTVSSSRRFKEDIQDMGSTSDRLLELRPVTFRYKEAYADGDKPIDFGLIAEEVAEVFPELVVEDDNNQPETVKYRLLSSLLLNELQKQNARLVSQEKKLVELSSQMAELQQQAGQVAQVDPASASGR